MKSDTATSTKEKTNQYNYLLIVCPNSIDFVPYIYYTYSERGL